MDPKTTKLTISELHRRLGHLPVDTFRSVECEVTEGEAEVTIVIPASVFGGDDPRSLLAKDGGVYDITRRDE